MPRYSAGRAADRQAALCRPISVRSGRRTGGYLPWCDEAYTRRHHGRGNAAVNHRIIEGMASLSGGSDASVTFWTADSGIDGYRNAASRRIAGEHVWRMLLSALITLCGRNHTQHIYFIGSEFDSARKAPLNMVRANGVKDTTF